MKKDSSGIHHITAISGDVLQTVEFYRDLLGLRLVKKTVNFDDPGTYHLYFGDKTGKPGTILTFFPWGNNGWPGRGGTGQVISIAFAAPEKAIPFWKNRLEENGIAVNGPGERYGETYISFRDPDGIHLDITGISESATNNWNSGEIPAENNISGFHSATLAVRNKNATVSLLQKHLGFTRINAKGSRIRFQAGERGSGSMIDLLELPDTPHGNMGRGAVHHIAFRTLNSETQELHRTNLIRDGQQVTPVRDRNYFRSIYFREPGGILFEIATDEPGFNVDEEIAGLGKSLKLPGWLESRREELEQSLTEIPEQSIFPKRVES